MPFIAALRQQETPGRFGMLDDQALALRMIAIRRRRTGVRSENGTACDVWGETRQSRAQIGVRVHTLRPRVAA
ncbi:hypothetical protein [Rhodococcus sp. NPDC049939]|uniref:hypothetical protein n=1 Tax=Rhodococcus sp. NPDC049939 TaxID=3155511 RepID=UPI0033CE5F7B